MAERLPLSAVIITLNEEENIARCLKSLEWADERLVVDSGSTDKTLEIAQQCGARVLSHKWEGYGQQKNWANSQAKHDWILSVDADEEISPELREETQKFLSTNGKIHSQQFWGAEIPRRTWYLGRWIMHGGWYPNHLVRLAHRAHAKWTEPKIHESWEVNGAVHRMSADIFHYTFKNVGDQVLTNIKFSRLGAEQAKNRGECGSLWKILTKPVGKFLETYVWKLGFLDALPGFVISINAAHSMFMKYVELRFEKNSHHR